ncbi:transcriptional regulator [Rhodophyticola sp. CCM32]|nr:winged helix-turn-helix transcriptional regulator [Rhodophyticola sp. CCM32]QBY01951.1 transcriptional regulator [Rhodophyticola sp. CCM32]
MDIDMLVKVTSRAWSLNILALMHSGIPGRQAPLLSASGASRTAFAPSLVHLVNLGLLERNPGHGHPLRPEYRLTSKGAEIAVIAEKIKTAVPGETQSAILRRAWTVPVLAVSRKPRYFSEIKTALVSVTDRALSQSLRQLQESRWVSREVDTTKNPPRPLYQAANAGIDIGEAVNLSMS